MKMLMLNLLEEDGMESVLHHCEAVIIVLNDGGQQPIKVGGSARRRVCGATWVREASGGVGGSF